MNTRVCVVSFYHAETTVCKCTCLCTRTYRQLISPVLSSVALDTGFHLYMSLGVQSPPQPLLGASRNVSGGETMRDDPNNGCGGDYWVCDRNVLVVETRRYVKMQIYCNLPYSIRRGSIRVSTVLRKSVRYFRITQKLQKGDSRNKKKSITFLKGTRPWTPLEGTRCFGISYHLSWIRA